MSERRRLANQANAKASTGPKTKAGKANSARNALRHGLTIPVSSDPALVPQAEAIARKIAGPNASAASLEKARRIAEAQVELSRVRSLRNKALAAILSEPYTPSIRTVRQVRLIGRFLDRVDRGSVRPIDLEMVDPVLHQKPGGSDEAVAMNLAERALELARLDRYERRALSRRKFAIREFDALHSTKTP
jgi:hypothetical protein